MKCVKCDFECCNSNENGTEYYCAIFGDDIPKSLETDGGCECALNYNEAKKLCELHDKLCELHDKCMAMYYEIMSLLYEFGEGPRTKEKQAEWDKVNEEYSLASKNYHNYFDFVVSRKRKDE